MAKLIVRKLTPRRRRIDVRRTVRGESGDAYRALVARFGAHAVAAGLRMPVIASAAR